MLHRFIFALTLILLFGFGQIGAITHEISHYSDISSQSSSDKTSSKDSLPHSQVCEKCLSYAELGNALQSAEVGLLSQLFGYATFSSYSYSLAYEKPYTYSARAPPSLA